MTLFWAAIRRDSISLKRLLFLSHIFFFRLFVTWNIQQFFSSSYFCFLVIVVLLILCCLSDSKSPQVFRTLFGVLANLNIFIIWFVSNRPPISNFSRHISYHLGSVPSASITIGITITCMFHRFFSSQVQFFLYLFTFFYFHSEVHLYFFLLICATFGFQVRTWRILCVSDWFCCVYHLIV